jgi:hypothetical protein
VGQASRRGEGEEGGFRSSSVAFGPPCIRMSSGEVAGSRRRVSYDVVPDRPKLLPRGLKRESDLWPCSH